MRLNFLFCAVLFACVVSNDGQLKKETYMTVPQLITAAGYPAEKYRVKTEDGYILQIHRIPAGRRAARRTDTGGKGKKVVLVCHGLVGSSGDFVIMGPDRSLAYMLADAGYDVWLANLRGTIYTGHQNLTKSDPAFWEFSFHEHGKYDMPAIIDKVRNVTKQDKILYLGYSMGTTTFFVMMSERPEYNDKIYAFVGLGPAVYLDNIKPLSEFLLNSGLTTSMRSRGVNSLVVRREVMEMIIGGVCNIGQPEQDLCTRILFSVVGEDYEQIDPKMIPVILARFQPASFRQLEHFGKIAVTGVFTSWEDGLYGAVKPYKLTNVRIPALLLYGENDQLTEKTQIKRLASVLNSTGTLEDVRTACGWHKFNHLDFVFAKDVGKIFNKPLIAAIDDMHNKYSPPA